MGRCRRYGGDRIIWEVGDRWRRRCEDIRVLIGIRGRCRFFFLRGSMFGIRYIVGV